MPDRTCNRSCGMPVALSSGRIRNGSRQARHSPNLARRHGGDQGRPADDRQAAALGSRPAGFMSSFPGPDGRSAEPRRVMASGSATPVERLLADAVPTRRRESPKHVTPAHQAGREAAQVQGTPTGMEDRMQTVTPGASHPEVTPIAHGTWQFGGDREPVDEQAAVAGLVREGLTRHVGSPTTARTRSSRSPRRPRRNRQHHSPAVPLGGPALEGMT